MTVGWRCYAWFLIENQCFDRIAAHAPSGHSKGHTCNVRIVQVGLVSIPSLPFLPAGIFHSHRQFRSPMLLCLAWWSFLFIVAITVVPICLLIDFAGCLVLCWPGARSNLVRWFASIPIVVRASFNHISMRMLFQWS